MRRSFLKLILIVCFLTVTSLTYAQGPGGGPGPCPNPPCGPPNPVGLPIDGGIFFLLASGVAYAVGKLKK